MLNIELPHDPAILRLDNTHEKWEYSSSTNYTWMCLVALFIIAEKEKQSRYFPGGSVVKTMCFHCGERGSIPGWGTRNNQRRTKRKI